MPDLQQVIMVFQRLIILAVQMFQAVSMFFLRIEPLIFYFPSHPSPLYQIAYIFSCDSNPGDGDNNKPGNGENKPSDGSDKQPNTGENKPTNGNQQLPNDNNAQNQNKEHSSNIGSSVDAAPFSTTQITDLPTEDNAINSAPVKDQEPQTGDEASTGIYIITAILASLALALLHVLESFDTGDPIQRVKQHTSIPFRTHITHNTQKLKKKDRAFEIIWTRRKQYSFSSG